MEREWTILFEACKIHLHEFQFFFYQFHVRIFSCIISRHTVFVSNSSRRQSDFLSVMWGFFDQFKKQIRNCLDRFSSKRAVTAATPYLRRVLRYSCQSMKITVCRLPKENKMQFYPFGSQWISLKWKYDLKFTLSYGLY